MSLILIADDDAEMRRMLGEALGRDGFNVELIADGQQLQHRLKEMASAGQLPDIIIADIQMPGMTGMHVLAWAYLQIPAIPIILITAFGDQRTHLRATKLGAAAIFDKPFDLEDLRATIQNLLQQRDVELGA
jgi:two-component system response regulator (stage 0 sporulation protein F)